MACQGLAVYDLVESDAIRLLNSVGCGLHHTGVVFACLPGECNEVSFNQNGFFFLPHGSAGHAYQDTIPLDGPFVSKEVLAFVLALMRDQLGWAKGRYCIAEGRCCVTFSRALVSLLGLRKFPDFADRGGRFLSSVPGASVFGDLSCTGAVSESESDEEDVRMSNPFSGVRIQLAMPPAPGFRPAKRISAESVEMPVAKRRKIGVRADQGHEHVHCSTVAKRPDIVLNLRSLARMVSLSGKARGFAGQGHRNTPLDQFEPVNSNIVCMLYPGITSRVAKMFIKAAKGEM